VICFGIWDISAFRMAGWLDIWIAGRRNGRMVGWLDDDVVGWLDGWMAEWLDV
jgi:hypothetical protein